MTERQLELLGWKDALKGNRPRSFTIQADIEAYTRGWAQASVMLFWESRTDIQQSEYVH